MEDPSKKRPNPAKLRLIRFIVRLPARDAYAPDQCRVFSKQLMFDREIEKDAVVVGGLSVNAHRNSYTDDRLKLVPVDHSSPDPWIIVD